MKTATGTTLIRNGRLVDGTGAPPVPDAALLSRAGLIAYAGPAAVRNPGRRQGVAPHRRTTWLLRSTP